MLAAARIDLALFLKEIERDRHTVILRIIAVLPCAVNIRKVVNIGVVAQHLFVLIERVYVENEPAVVIHEKRHAVKCRLHLRFAGEVVDAVQRTEHRVDRAEQVERLHFLTKEHHISFHVVSLVLRFGQHGDGAVHAVHIHAKLIKLQRKAAGTAGKV